ncbi:uncharacterized protein J3R85_014306 [Psidium guajava]|nr:uncharacterized protein J3R85_014306 [Psidium guajava]
MAAFDKVPQSKFASEFLVLIQEHFLSMLPLTGGDLTILAPPPTALCIATSASLGLSIVIFCFHRGITLSCDVCLCLCMKRHCVEKQRTVGGRREEPSCHLHSEGA